MRPKQWLKNVLVLAAPFASGRLLESGVWLGLFGAFAAFVLASSCIYLVNDIKDVAEDRIHPTKRFRPIAAGELSVTAAWAMAGVTGVGALALCWFISPYLLATVACYLALQTGYAFWLKDRPIVDIAVVAAGFLLRAIAGGTACDIELSQWFLLVVSFGSLFVVAGKRYSELKELGGDAGTRRSLEHYTLSFLFMVWVVSIAVMIVSYSLWAFEQHGQNLWGVDWAVISIVPLTLALLRYVQEIDAGRAGEPENVLLGDRTLQVLALLWMLPVVLEVFGGR
jgi:decaprenyl-phosphate phosphoribosyltransferase